MADASKASQRASSADNARAQPPLAFLFTDLHRSTALYEHLGDAAGYEIVSRYFAFVADIVGDNDGVVVKTIGDATMATFANSPDAVRAALALQAGSATFAQAHAALGTDHRLAMKLGVHCGKSVRVRFGKQFDYFGSSVNMAARLQDLSVNGDIVLSSSVAEHPEVRPLLAAVPILEQRLYLRGFAEMVRIVRVASADGHQTAAGSFDPLPTRFAARVPQMCLALSGY